MNSSEPRQSRKTVPNFLILCLAVGSAIAMWYTVTMHERQETQVEVPLNYYGIPHDLMVTEGLAGKLTVRVRGPAKLLRAMEKQNLTRTIDLSGIKQGENIVPLGNVELGPETRTFEIVDIQPPRITVHADKIMEKSVKVVVRLANPVRGGAISYEKAVADPATVVLKGPESRISKISSIPLYVPIDPEKEGPRVEKTITLDTDSFITSSPPAVKVSYTITSGRAVQQRRYPIQILDNGSHKFEVNPKNVSLMVEVPDNLARDASYLSSLKVTVVPPPLKEGESVETPLRFEPPEGMTVLKGRDADIKVTLTRIKK